MNHGSLSSLLLLLPATLLLSGCPGPRAPLETAQPPIEGTRSTQALAELTAATDSPAPAIEWHRWRGPNLDGISPDSNWNPVFPPDGPKQLWKNKVGVGFSSISVSNGRVYTMGHADKQDSVYCFDLETGQEIWTHSYPAELGDKYYEGGPSATPAVDGNAVYTLSKVGDLFCLNAATGEVIWSKNLSRELSAEIPTWGYASSVLTQGDRAFVNVGTFGTALDKNNGEILWTTGKDASGYATPVPFTMEGEPALAIFAAHYVVGVKQSDGKLLWRHPWKTDYDVNAADPIVSGNTVFISSGYNTGCALLKIENGDATEIWRNQEMRNQINNSILLDGYIYGIDGDTGERRPQLKCLDHQTGEVKWAEPILGTGSLIAADGKLIVISGKGELLTVEATPQAFKEISRAQVIGGKNWTAPALSNGRLLLRNAQGDLICLDLRKS